MLSMYFKINFRIFYSQIHVSLFRPKTVSPYFSFLNKFQMLKIEFSDLKIILILIITHTIY